MTRFFLLAIAILLALAAPAAAQYEPPPRLSVAPATAFPDQEITVTMEGCGLPEGTLIDVSIQGVFFGTGTMNNDGGFDLVGPAPAPVGGFSGALAVIVPITAPCVTDTTTVAEPTELRLIPAEVGGVSVVAGQGGNLAQTGSDSFPLAKLGGGLIGAGALFVILAARRRQSTIQV
jgi:hypothetical protein